MFYISVILLAALIAVQIAKKWFWYKLESRKNCCNRIINSIHIGSHLYVITNGYVDSFYSSFWLVREFINRFYHWLYGLCVCIKYPLFEEFEFKIQYSISFRTWKWIKRPNGVYTNLYLLSINQRWTDFYWNNIILPDILGYSHWCNRCLCCS